CLIPCQSTGKLEHFRLAPILPPAHTFPWIHAALGLTSYATTAAGMVGAWAINQRLRRGLSTNIASNAPIQSNAIANIKIGYQRPVLPAIKLPIGTSNDAVPLAVYSKP